MCVCGWGGGGDKVCDICGFMGWERGGGMGGGGLDKVCGCMWLYETGRGGGGWRDGCKDAS